MFDPSEAHSLRHWGGFDESGFVEVVVLGAEEAEAVLPGCEMKEWFERGEAAGGQQSVNSGSSW